jgi:hypothetical protein
MNINLRMICTYIREIPLFLVVGRHPVLFLVVGQRPERTNIPPTNKLIDISDQFTQK